MLWWAVFILDCEKNRSHQKRVYIWPKWLSKLVRGHALRTMLALIHVLVCTRTLPAQCVRSVGPAAGPSGRNTSWEQSWLCRLGFGIWGFHATETPGGPRLPLEVHLCLTEPGTLLWHSHLQDCKQNGGQRCKRHDSDQVIQMIFNGHSFVDIDLCCCCRCHIQ